MKHHTKMGVKETLKKAEQSVRYPFIAEHRGGPLSKENHRKLMRWARACVEHILPLADKEIDKRLLDAIDVAREWENDRVKTGVAMKASLLAHEAARQSEDQLHKAMARAIGQALATAHMADHALGAAFYALKTVKLANKNVENERAWQMRKLNDLPPDIISIVRSMWELKALDRRV